MRFLYLLLLSIIFSCARSIKKPINTTFITNQLDSLIEVQDYFKLKKYFLTNKNLLPEENSLYYEAILLNRFNNLARSNDQIEKLLSFENSNLNDTLLNKIYHTKLLNHINLYEYKKAAEVSESILKRYRYLNDSSKIETIENEFNIWKSLENIRPQEIIKSKDTDIPLTIDKATLLNIDVTINGITNNYIFDTGANISVIKKSLVNDLGLKPIESDFYVTAFTGKKVDSQLAIAEELSIGGITFKNVVFLVLNDEDISFPQFDYYINGIIGFPVIEAMEEIRISKNNIISTPLTPSVYSLNNFAIDGLTPIVAVQYNKDTLSFGLDTGAKSTSLYAPFYRKYTKSIEDKYKPQTITSGSAGGTVDFEGFVIDSIQFTIGNSMASLNNMQLHKSDFKVDINNFYGNLGQDFIQQFDEMIISFKYGSIFFK